MAMTQVYTQVRDALSAMSGPRFYSDVSRVATVVTVGATALWCYGMYRKIHKDAAHNAAATAKVRSVSNGKCAAARAVSGHRLMQDAASSDVYASDEYLSKYMEFSYAPQAYYFCKTFNLRAITDAFNFHERLAKKFEKYVDRTSALRGLELGCGTGASTFYMARYFSNGVIGTDRSERFVQAATQVKKQLMAGKALTFSAPLQGDVLEHFTVTMSDEVRANAHRCEFYVADCMDLMAPSPTAAPCDATRLWRVQPGERFAGVLCVNVIDRVPDPMRLLDSFAALLEPNGVLVLADPYSWDASVTPHAAWLGGKDGKRSEDVVKAVLTRKFRLMEETDEAFIIRDHVRRYQLGISHCTVWRKL